MPQVLTQFLDTEQVQSDKIADELERRGWNTQSRSVQTTLSFIAGRLPNGLATGKDLARALDEAFLMDERPSPDVIEISIAAFVEAKRGSSEFAN